MPDVEETGAYRYCALKPTPEPAVPADMNPERASAIIADRAKWANGTTIRFYFFDQPSHASIRIVNGQVQAQSWVGPEDQRKVVRDAFAEWKALGLGLDFKEVGSPEEAEVRIGFLQGDGAWSYIGTDVLGIPPKERTMNFGWRLTGEDGRTTALHEIGHTLGLPHEHQNPFAGIVWNEETVYRSLGGPPNSWDREKVFHNILRKLAPDTVQGSSWDPDSVMHYPFEPGLILAPPPYDQGLTPAGGLSARDKSWVLRFYPAGGALVPLKPGESRVLALKDGEQADFLVEPTVTREYHIQTFGSCDTLIVAFEERNGEWRYLDGEDDAGEDRNAHLKQRLVSGRRYAVRVLLKYSDGASTPSIMLW